MSEDTSSIEKGYFGEPGRQVHFRRAGPRKTEQSEVPLLCLPPAPHSGAFFESFIADVKETRQVIVPDCPGYGGSDRIDQSDLSISDYAKRLSICLKNEIEVDLFGFHSGTFIAVELARLFPESVRDIILVDIPCFDKSIRDAQTAKLKTGLPSSIQDSYDKAVTQRRAGLSEERAFALWAESLRSGAFQADLFRAAFGYDWKQNLSNFERPVKIIATQSGLLEATRQAAEVFPKTCLTERLDILPPTFEIHSNDISELIKTF